LLVTKRLAREPSEARYITQASPGPLLGLLSPWTLTAMIAGVIAFYASARSLH
jgi:hypothetical protein